ncbi:MAG: hypothetical protein H0X38_01050, partial [Planctomycetes bacterium]|nr:hypothetical protein [Planctomycetota bacterium]
VALGRDATTLYLAYHVVEEAPLRNQGADWRTLFTSGDCVDLMLAGDATADGHRRGAVAGDLRLLMSVFQGKPLAVLYRPVVPGATARVQLMAAQLDRIDQLAEARVAVRRGEGFYEVEAAVPLAALGIAAGEAGTLRGDVGVIYADATGRDRAKRSYHFNQRTTVTADLTTEATLQPAEWGPMVFPLGRNLVRNGGFEAGFSDRAEDGWRVVEQGGGLGAKPAVEAARSGRRGLLIRQLTPVIYPPEAFDLPDYGAFIRAANGGAGGGRVTVLQTVPVTGGRLYSLRFWRRAEGMKPEEKRPGKGRGYSTLSPTIDWHGGAGGGTWVANLQDDAPAWVGNRDTRFNDYGVAKPYVAPAGATSATIAFHANVNAPDILPTICVDDVEFVEVGGP